MTVSATASSGLPVSFAVQSGPAVLDGTNVTFNGIGPVAITADQAGSLNYFAAPTKTNSFMTTGPQWNLLGTNGAVIASGAPTACRPAPASSPPS